MRGRDGTRASRIGAPGFAGWRAALIATLLLLAAPLARAGGIVLYTSPTTQAYLVKVGGSYDAVAGPWRRMLAARRIAYREADGPAALAALKPDDVLVLPSAVALDAPERRALLRWRDGGGALLATWATGSRDAAGQWLGHEFLRELTGVQVSGEIAPDGARRFVIPFGDTPVNHAVPAGRRIWVGQLAEKPLLLQGGVVAATYMDWARTVLKRDDQPAAIVYEEGTGPGRPTGSGRRVVFGYAETAWSFQPDDYQALAEQALRWLQHRPQAAIAAWPNGQRAAQLLEMDTEEGFANAVHFAELMAQVRGAGTFYCLTQEVRRHVELVRRLARDHEVAFHGEVHLGFQSLSRDKQRRRLERMLAEMKQGLGTGPDGWPLGAGRGFRAPTESYDDATESLLRELGLRHHTADPNRSNDRLPMFAAAGASDAAGDLVVLPRGQLDDLNYMQLQLSAEQVGQALVGEYEYNRRLGGLAIVSVHSQNFAPASQLLTRPLHTSLMTVAAEALIRHIGPAHEGVWIAPGGQIADWWRERSRASLTTRAGDGGTLELELSVAGKAPLQGLTLLIDHRSDGRMPIWQRSGAAPAGGTPLPTLRKLDRFSSLLVFPTLPAGRHSYRVVLP